MWSKLEVFYHIVKAGSLVKAAKVLKTDQPALTHKLKTLEKKFGFKLINRSTPQKPLTLTRKGKIVFESAQKTFMTIQMMDTELKEDEGLKGSLRLSTTHAIGNYIIGPLLLEFADLYPDIDIELLCSDSNIDVINNEVDLAVRPYMEDEPGLVQEHLFTINAEIYGSPEYLKKFGTPVKASDLNHHRLITFARGSENSYSEVDWMLKVGREKQKERNPFYTSNSTANILDAAEKGKGLVTFYDVMQKNRKSNLKKVLEELEGPTYKDYIIYPKKLEEVEKVKILKNFLKEKLSK